MHIKLLRQKVAGISLIEIMIAVALSVILLGGLVAITGKIYFYSLKITLYSQLQTELQNAMDMMVRDLRRAGFWSNEQSKTLSGSGNASNPFMVSGSPTSDISIQSIGSGTNNCILFSYDYNQDGTLGNTRVVNTNDHFGYKLSNNTLYALTTDQNYNCTSNTYWEQVTTPNVITVTTLNFTLTNATIAGTTKTLTMRFLTITLAGQLSSDPSMQLTLTRNITIRENKIT